MKNFSLFWLIAGLFSIVSAGTTSCNAPQNQAFEMDKAFTLHYGETAQWTADETIQIRFDSTLDDSRCPKGVQCVWAGRAVAGITFSQNGEMQNGALVLGDPAGTNYSNTATFGDFTVTLNQVNPHPVAEQKIQPNDYSVELEIKKTE